MDGERESGGGRREREKENWIEEEMGKGSKAGEREGNLAAVCACVCACVLESISRMCQRPGMGEAEGKIFNSLGS